MIGFQNMTAMFSIELDRQAKISIWVSLGLLGLLGYMWGLLIIIMTHPVDKADDKPVWTCRLREQAEQDGFELLEKADLV